MREYVGTIAKISGETFVLSHQTREGTKLLTARLVPPDPTVKIAVGVKVKIIGDWAGNLGAGALTTFTVRKIEIL